MIDEVRWQFHEIPGLLGDKAKAEYAKCVDISAAAAIRKMVLPGLIAVAVPVSVGFIDKYALGDLLVGVTVSGVLLAIFKDTSGPSWSS